MDRVTVRLRRWRWVDQFIDTHPNLGLDDGSYQAKRDEVDASPQWQRIRRLTRSAFGAKCYTCHAGTALETAHIDYPETGPGTERIDPDNLWESDVVLLCHECHRMLDGDSQRLTFSDVAALRAAVIRLIGNIGEDE